MGSLVTERVMTRLALILTVTSMLLWDEYAALPAILTGLLVALLQERRTQYASNH